MILRLERFGRDRDATWGRLYLQGLDDPLFTVERSWSYNRRNQSCIPAGVYDLESHESRKHGSSWALVGPGISHWDEPGMSRFGILIHSANFARQVEGCIAPGTAIGSILGEAGVMNSSATCALLGEHIQMAIEPQIEITWGSIG